MHVRSPRLLVTVVAAVPAALAVAVAAVPSARAAETARGAAAVSTAVGVSQREFRLTPYRSRVPAGEVRFNVTNFGEDVHDLVVRDARGRIVRRSPEIRAGARQTLAVRLRRGRYRLSCDVADHAARGMTARFTVVRAR